MINFKFLFKLDLIDISSIDFYFSDSYETLETDPILTKRYPTAGTVAYGAIYMPVENEEVEELPDVFYAEAVINFNDNTSIKAHARTLKNQEALLTTILNDGDEDIDVKFHIDESSGGSGTSDYADLTNKPSINSVTLSGNKTTSDLGLQAEITSQNKLSADYMQDGNTNKPSNWNAKSKVFDAAMVSGEILQDVRYYPNIQYGDIAIEKLNKRIWIQAQAPTSDTVYWNEIEYSKAKITKSSNDPGTSGMGNVGDIWIKGNQVWVLTNRTGNHPPYNFTWTEVTQDLSTYQPLIDSTNKLDADYIQNGSNYMLIPKPTAADAGKVLKVNASGEPEWITE